MRFYFSTITSMFLVLFGFCSWAEELHNNEDPNGVGVESLFDSSGEWSGRYLKKSELCTSPGNGSGCSERFNDCLEIKPEGSGYLVRLHSTQANQHVCFFSLQMDAVDGMLVHQTKFGSVFLMRTENFLEISSKGMDSTALGLGLCGAHADIDGLKFDISKRTNSVLKCMSPN